MSSENNAAQPYDFSGSVPRHYDDHLGPLFFEPYALEVAARIDPGFVQQALELACGTGRVTRHLRSVLPPASELIASDISAEMMAVAQERLAGTSIRWQVIDAQHLPFAAGQLDLVVCCFGYMFVPDRARAFAEAFRVLRPGGQLLFTTWDRLENNGASHAYRKLIKKYLTEPLPEYLGLPFSMSDAEVIKSMLRDAGFSTITAEKIARVSVCETAQQAARALATGGTVYQELMRRNPAWVEQITASLEKELAEKFGDAPMIAPMSALVCQAWKQARRAE